MENLEGLNRAVEEVTENFARIQTTLSPYTAMSDFLKSIQFPSPTSTITKIAESVSPRAQLTVLSQAAAAMQREHLLIAKLAIDPRFSDDISNQLNQLRAVNERITEPYRAIHDQLQLQSTAFDRLSAQALALNSVSCDVAQFSRSQLAWNVTSIGLANRMVDIGLFSQREQLSSRLFGLPNAYGEFVRVTTERLAADPSPDIAARLRGSLNLAEQQLLGIADAVSNFIAVPDDNDEPGDARILDAPFDQQNELLGSPSIVGEFDVESMTIASTTAQTAQRGRRVLELVTLCNEAGKTSESGVEIFKPTTRLMIAFNDLPWLSPTDRWRFADVVDCLYFIFYEGAGRDNLRFLEEHGGPLSKADCDLIWCIKHLRNKWSRHDADHGKDKDIQKSWTELAAKFRWLGLAEHPTDAHHFQQLHLQLLVLAEIFLAKILNKLRLKH